MEFLTMEEAAHLLRVSYDQLSRIINSGSNHPPFIMVGKSRRFVREQVLEWAKNQAEA